MQTINQWTAIRISWNLQQRRGLTALTAANFEKYIRNNLLGKWQQEQVDNGNGVAMGTSIME